MNPSGPMNNEERKMLLDVIDLAKDNNVILHKLLRAQRWAGFWRLLYWVVIIGSLVVGYYWLQPVLAPFISFFNSQDFAKAMSMFHALPSK